MRKKTILLLSIALITHSKLSLALTLQQQIFLDSEKALENKNDELYQVLVDKLQNYELLPYLRYKKISQNLSTSDTQEVNDFIKKFPDTILSKELYFNWTYYLVNNKIWNKVLQLNSKSNINISDPRSQCISALAKFKVKKVFPKNINDIWNKSNITSYYCHELLLNSIRYNRISSYDFWKKIAEYKNPPKDFINIYKKHYPKMEKLYINKFLKYSKNPEEILKNKKISNNNFYNYIILNSIIKKIDKENIIKLSRAWPRVINNYNFEKKYLDRLYHQMAQYLFFSSKTETKKFIAKIPKENIFDKIYRISALTSMANNNWLGLIATIKHMPKAQRESLEWKYWLAKAYIKTNNKTSAYKIFQEIAKTRSYHGFLASNILNIPPSFNYNPSIINYEDLNKIKNNIQLRRALELYAIHKKNYALREWLTAINSFSDEDKIMAAKLATIKGWNHAAILSLLKVSDNNDILSRFPLTYFNEISNYAKNNDLNPALIYAINRQESSFAINAISHAGAKGLMQITDSTFKILAKELNMNNINLDDIYTPEINLKLGSYYISKLLRRYHSNIILSIAAYNAGPLSVYKWPYIKDYDPDVWVEIIPYKETRNYVKNALTFATIYEYRLEQKYSILNQAIPLSS